MCCAVRAQRGVVLRQLVDLERHEARVDPDHRVGQALLKRRIDLRERDVERHHPQRLRRLRREALGDHAQGPAGRRRRADRGRAHDVGGRRRSRYSRRGRRGPPIPARNSPAPKQLGDARSPPPGSDGVTKGISNILWRRKAARLVGGVAGRPIGHLIAHRAPAVPARRAGSRRGTPRPRGRHRSPRVNQSKPRPQTSGTSEASGLGEEKVSVTASPSYAISGSAGRYLMGQPVLHREGGAGRARQGQARRRTAEPGADMRRGHHRAASSIGDRDRDRRRSGGGD